MVTLTVEETLAGWFYDLCKLVSSVLEWVINLLPDSTLSAMTSLPEGVSQYLGWLNWFLPIAEIIVMLAGWVSALLLYFLIAIVMKWVKIVGGD